MELPLIESYDINNPLGGVIAALDNIMIARVSVYTPDMLHDAMKSE